MNIAHRHCTARPVKNRGFIHIIPDTIYTISQKVFIKTCPPCTCFGTRKVGKSTITRPYFAMKFITISITYKYILLFPCFIYKIILVYLHSGIYHINRTKSIAMQIIIHTLRIGKVPVIDGKYTKFIHIIDVKPNHITWNLFLTKCIGYFFYSSLRYIGET